MLTKGAILKLLIKKLQYEAYKKQQQLISDIKRKQEIEM